MAAWIVVGGIGVFILGQWVGWWLATRWVRQQQAREELEAKLRAATERPGDGELLERVLERLLGAVVPEPPKQPAPDEVETRSDGEYEAPEDEVGDWTDTFLLPERPLIARLAPGESPIPAPPAANYGTAGAAAFDEWEAETEGASGVAGGSWVDPIHLDGEVQG